MRRLGKALFVGVAAGSVVASACGGSTTTTSATKATAGGETVGGEKIAARPGGVGQAAVVAVDPRTGSVRWRTTVPMASAGPPVVAGDRVLVEGAYDCNSAQATLAALDVTTGKLVWAAPVAAASTCFGNDRPAVVGNVVVASASGSGPTTLQVAGAPAPCASPSCPATPSTSPAPPTSVIGRDVETGRRVWTTSIAAGFVEWSGVSGAAVGNSPNADPSLDALDGATGRQRWTAQPTFGAAGVVGIGDMAYTVGQAQLAPPPANGTIIPPGQPLPDNGQRFGVSAIDLTTGRERWHTVLGHADGFHNPVGVDAVVVAYSAPPADGAPAPGAGSTTVAVLDPVSGTVRWQRTEPEGQGAPLGVADGPGAVYLVRAGPTTSIESFDARTSAHRWSTTVPVAGGAVSASSATVAVAGSVLIALDATNGARLWQRAGRYSSATVADSVIIAASPARPKNVPTGE
jgi:outer membrane protein assembly factor BamB